VRGHPLPTVKTHDQDSMHALASLSTGQCREAAAVSHDALPGALAALGSEGTSWAAGGSTSRARSERAGGAAWVGVGGLLINIYATNCAGVRRRPTARGNATAPRHQRVVARSATACYTLGMANAEKCTDRRLWGEKCKREASL